MERERGRVSEICAVIVDDDDDDDKVKAYQYPLSVEKYFKCRSCIHQH